MNMDIKTRPGLRIRPTTAIKKRKGLMKSRNTRGYFHWILQFLKEFHDLVDILTIFQEKTEQTLEK